MGTQGGKKNVLSQFSFEFRDPGRVGTRVSQPLVVKHYWWSLKKPGPSFFLNHQQRLPLFLTQTGSHKCVPGTRQDSGSLLGSHSDSPGNRWLSPRQVCEEQDDEMCQEAWGHTFWPSFQTLVLWQPAVVSSLANFPGTPYRYSNLVVYNYKLCRSGHIWN